TGMPLNPISLVSCMIKLTNLYYSIDLEDYYFISQVSFIYNHFKSYCVERFQKSRRSKIDKNWDKVMKETRGAWCKHPVFKEMDDAVEIVKWMRGRETFAAVPVSE
ncbi:MAG: hypothetical protein Q7J35_08805, partial [Candidatus Methanoperedens sp.]|nr:hypothetical protein [Candidatus Methanoperedens sp.]